MKRLLLLLLLFVTSIGCNSKNVEKTKEINAKPEEFSIEKFDFSEEVEIYDYSGYTDFKTVLEHYYKDKEIFKGVKQINFGGNTHYVVDNKSNLWGWGDNRNNNVTSAFRNSPEPLSDLYLKLVTTAEMEGVNVFNPMKVKNNISNIIYNSKYSSLVIVEDIDGKLFVKGRDFNGIMHPFGLSSSEGITDIGHEFVEIDMKRFSEYVGKEVNNFQEINITDSGTMFVVTDQGDLYGWGRDNETGILGSPFESKELTLKEFDIRGISKLYVDDRNVFSLTEDGELYGWGDNSSGVFGENEKNIYTPILLADTEYETKDFHVLKDYIVYGLVIVKEDAENNILLNYAIGNNKKGTLGIGLEEIELTEKPYAMGNMYQKVIVKVIGSFGNYYAITEDGSLYNWGRLDLDKLIEMNGNNTNPTKVIEAPKGIKDILYNGSSLMLLTEEGHIYTKGHTSYGTLGIRPDNMSQEDYENFEIKEFVKLDLNNVERIYTTNNTVKSTVFALTEDGLLYGWGKNNSDLFGVGGFGENVIYEPRLIK